MVRTASLEVGFLSNPKVVRAGKDATLLYIAGLLYAAREMSDGFLPSDKLRRIAMDVDLADLDKTVAALVDWELWEVVDGGYMVHDYLKHNRSADAIRKSLASGRERQRRHREKAVSDNDTPVADVTRDNPAVTVSNALRGVSNALHVGKAGDDTRTRTRVSEQARRPELKTVSVNRDVQDKQISSTSTRAGERASEPERASEYAKPTPPTPSDLETAIGHDAVARFVMRFEKADASLDAIWMTRTLWIIQRELPEISKGAAMNALQKAATSIKPDAARSSVTAYAASVVLDRARNEAALEARKRAAHQHGQSAVGGGGAPSGSHDGGDGGVGVGDRGALRRDQIARILGGGDEPHQHSNAAAGNRRDAG